MKEKRILYDKYLWLAFVIAFIPRLFFNVIAVPMRVSSDEISTLAGAAYLAGFDWREATTIAGYYGIGFTSIFAPLFKVEIDPVVRYRIILVVFSIIQSFIVPIAYIAMEKYFNITNRKILCGISVGCSYLVAITTTYIYNEHVLILISWILMFVLLELHCIRNDSKKKRMYTLILVLVLVYSLTIHTRSIVYWGGVLVLVVFYFFAYRKCLVSIPVFIFVGAGGYIFSKGIIQWSIDKIWMVSKDGIRNTSISLNGIDLLLADAKSWTSCFNIIVGQINTATIFSGGILIIGACVGIYYIWKNIIQRKRESVNEKNEKSAYYFICAVFSIIMIVAAIGGQSLSWLGGVYSSMVYQDYNNSALRAFTYLRYFMAYAGPLFLIGCVYLYSDFENKQKLFKKALVTMGIIQIFWVTSIVPYIANNESTSSYYLPFSIGTMLSGDIRIRTYLSSSVLLIVILLTLYVLLKLKHKLFVFIIISTMFIYEYSINAINVIEVEETNYSYVSESCNLIRKLKENMDFDIYIPNTQIEETGQSKYCLYQFLLPESKISIGMPDETKNEVVIISEEEFPESEIDLEDLEEIQLDENEFIYIKGEEIKKEFIKVSNEFDYH